jgi:hypothetical protein
VLSADALTDPDARFRPLAGGSGGLLGSGRDGEPGRAGRKHGPFQIKILIFLNGPWLGQVWPAHCGQGPGVGG